MSCSMLLKTHHYSLQGQPTPDLKHIQSVCPAYSDVQDNGENTAGTGRLMCGLRFCWSFIFTKQLTDIFHCHFSWVPACCRQTRLPNTVYPPICNRVVLDNHKECNSKFQVKLWTETNIQMQIRLFWPYQVKLGCFRGALRYCVSLWVFQLCTPG